MSKMRKPGVDLEFWTRSIDRLGWLAQAGLGMSKLRVQRFCLSYALVAALLAGVLPAEDQVPFVPSGNLHPIKVERVHDADTVFGVISLGLGISYEPEGGWRAANFDACEVSRVRERVVGKITDHEVEVGKKATADLIELLKLGQLYGKLGDVTDPHGRGSAEFYIKLPGGWLDVAAWMKAHGYLREQLPDHSKK